MRRVKNLESNGTYEKSFWKIWAVTGLTKGPGVFRAFGDGVRFAHRRGRANPLKCPPSTPGTAWPSLRCTRCAIFRSLSRTPPSSFWGIAVRACLCACLSVLLEPFFIYINPFLFAIWLPGPKRMSRTAGSVSLD